VESIVVGKHVQLEALAAVEQVLNRELDLLLLELQIPAAAAVAIAAVALVMLPQAALA